MKSKKADKLLFDKLEKCIWRKEILKIHLTLLHDTVFMIPLKIEKGFISFMEGETVSNFSSRKLKEKQSQNLCKK